MNWKLILQLSLFGLAMGIATVFFIPSNVEPFFWLAIFIISAVLIANRCSRAYFFHGFLVSIVNSIWITCAHALLFGNYAANHPEELAMMASLPLATHPRMMMVLMGPVIGILSGIVLGLFSFIASKLIRPG